MTLCFGSKPHQMLKVIRCSKHSSYRNGEPLTFDANRGHVASRYSLC
jgi:hypothetical protein